MNSPSQLPTFKAQNPNVLQRLTLTGLAILATSVAGYSAGIYTDGIGARSQALGGAGVTGLGSAVEALGANPAALSQTKRFQVEAGGNFGWVNGEFRNRANDGADLSDFGAMPHGAIAGKFGPVTLGLGVITDAALKADWDYRDAPGGLDGLTTHGTRQHLSEISVLRFAFGASYEITPDLSIGAGVGLLYNQNRLKAPYTIQTQTQLAGAKTLLDLDTEGWGWNGQFGILWKPVETVRLALSYTLPTQIKSDGSASADSTRQLGNLGLTDVDATADFDAEVTNEFPQVVSAGLAWQATSKLQLLGQVDWVNWADAFDTLEVRLKDVDNELYRTLMAGNSDLDDDVPLDWRDQWVFRLGAEYALDEHFAVRGGYRYARNPVPSETLTPLTAAIPEHVLSAGLGYKNGGFSADLAYQYHLPKEESVDNSKLLNGEYSDSEVEVSLHWLTVTVGFEF